MELETELYLLFFLAILIPCVLLLPETIKEDGIITDKYEIEHRSMYAYYFVIDNSTCIEVSFHDYRYYEVGDYFVYRRGNIVMIRR